MRCAHAERVLYARVVHPASQNAVAKVEEDKPARPRTPETYEERVGMAGARSKTDSPHFSDQPAYIRNNIDQLIGRMHSTSGMTVRSRICIAFTSF